MACICLLAVIKKNGKRPDAAKNAFFSAYFRLKREFDRTGTYTLGAESDGSKSSKFSLESDTKYHVRLGTLALDDPYRDDKIVTDQTLLDRLPPPENWVDDL
ncbi:MAG: hypothetical protein ACE10C_06840, partial [Candidatus Binatia bacterium]